MKQSLTPSQVTAFRLKRHHLGRRSGSIAAVARGVCGIQAQVMAAAELQLWARVPNLTRADIHAALWQDRTLVKTSLMRGTLHLVATEDYPVYISAVRASRARFIRHGLRKYGVTPEDTDKVTDVVLRTLAKGPMGRRELTGHVLSRVKVGKQARAWFEQSWWGVVRYAIIEGLVCYGADRGTEPTLVLVDQWLSPQPEVPEQDAAAELLRRYAAAYGPVTLQDFAKWTGMPVKEVERAFTALEGELADVTVGKERGWVLRKDRGHIARASTGADTVRLLPHFDPFMLGHAKKEHLVEPAHYKRVYRKAGWIYPVVLRNGRVIATWSYKRAGKRLAMTIEPFRTLSKPVRGKIEVEADRLGRFLDKLWEITYTA